MFEDLAGRVAVVTGGARGLGLSMGRALARHGVDVGLVDLLDDVEASAAALADDLGVESVGTTADVTSADEVAAAFAHVSATLGSPALLVNAAGITVWEDSLDVTADSWRRVIDINLTGTFLCCRRSAAAAATAVTAARSSTSRRCQAGSSTCPAPDLLQRLQGRGRPADQVARRGMGRAGGARQRGRSRLLPVRHDPAVHRVNPELAERWRGMIPAGRMGEPSDLDGLVAFLCSDASSYIVGQSIVIDGAYTAV